MAAIANGYVPIPPLVITIAIAPPINATKIGSNPREKVSGILNLTTYNIKKYDIQIKIADFGMATYFDDKMKLLEEVGSPIFMAPEILEGKRYDHRVDIWAVGVLTYYIICK